MPTNFGQPVPALFNILRQIFVCQNKSGYFFDDPVVWEQSGLDLTQIHFYSQAGGLTLVPDLARVVVDWPAQRVQAFGRPSLFAELGVAAAGPGETVAADPEGIGVHDGLWAGAFGGAMGSAIATAS